MSWELQLGARPRGDGADFRVWAPQRQTVEVAVYQDGQPIAVHPLARDDQGYWSGYIRGIGAGTRYMYRLDGDMDRPDPASRHQPDGVHGPSMVVDPAFAWTDAGWQGLTREQLVIYELHVGTATPDGTFESLVERLPDLCELGITAIELLPVADFPGDRNWGYDGVDLYAPARAYGGAEGLKRLVDAAHAQGLAVIQDVVYNHLGPAGNYLRDFSPDYFTSRHHTPWGDALNFDGPGSEAVRSFFIDNALYWAHEYHMDGLRLDATHAIIDDSPVHLIQELVERVHASLDPSRHFVLIAEDPRNEARLVRPIAAGGYGLDAVWADDFHHTVRVTLTGENEGYYRDFTGGAEEIAATLHSGWLFQGQPSPRTGRPRGTSAGDVPLAAYRAASVLLLLSPYMPLLFMGQEWAASSPFLFFTDHDLELGKLVTEGRREEFKHFTAFSGERVPDPQALETFECSRLCWEERAVEPHAGILRLYRDLLELRRSLAATDDDQRRSFQVHPAGEAGVALRRIAADGRPLLVVANLRGSNDLALTEEMAESGPWQGLLDSEDPRYSGGG